MSEVVVPLLDLPALVKAPSGQLPSKADFLCLLWGSVGGEGDQGRGGEGNKEGGAEGNQGGAGEGNKEDRGEEPDNNNDPDFQPPPRKRPHSGDREEGGGGGGDDESGVRHIAAQVPVNTLEIPVFGLKLPEVAKVHILPANVQVLHKIHLICFDVSGTRLFGICLKLFIFH